MKIYFLRTMKGFVFLGIAATLFLSCKKNVAGPQGDPGSSGKAGNLKLSLTTSVEVKSSSWIYNANEFNWESTLFIPEITIDVIERGEVKLYLEIDGQWNALPYGKNYIFTQYGVSEKKILLNNSHIHGGSPPRPPDGNYRVVVFSPSQ